MKAAFEKLMTATRELSTQLNQWSIWERLYVPGNTAWIGIRLSRSNTNAVLELTLEGEDLERICSLLEEILRRRLEEAENAQTLAMASKRDQPDERCTEDDERW